MSLTSVLSGKSLTSVHSGKSLTSVLSGKSRGLTSVLSSTFFNSLQLSSTPGDVENVLWDAFSSTLGGLGNVVFSHFCDIEFLCLRVKSKVKSKGESISASCRLGRVFLQLSSTPGGVEVWHPISLHQGQVYGRQAFVGLKDKPLSA